MAEQIRSATALVERILSDPTTVNELQNNPSGTLRKVEAEVVQQLPPPTGKTTNAIWLVIVIAFALALVYSVWILGQGVTAELKQGAVYATKSDMMLTVVTTIVGFLAGVLVPSPVGKRSSS